MVLNDTKAPRLLRWRDPVDDAERLARFFLLEDNGDRWLVVDVRSLYPGRMRSISCYQSADLEDAPNDEPAPCAS